METRVSRRILFALFRKCVPTFGRFLSLSLTGYCFLLPAAALLSREDTFSECYTAFQSIHMFFVSGQSGDTAVSSPVRIRTRAACWRPRGAGDTSEREKEIIHPWRVQNENKRSAQSNKSKNKWKKERNAPARFAPLTLLVEAVAGSALLHVVA
jgi:hypothetical protein